MKNIATGLALSAAAITGAEAQEPRHPHVAPDAVYAVAPGLGHFTDDVLFGEVWTGDDLAPRDRSLVTVAALVSTGKIAQIGSHVRRALDNGVTPAELGEVLTQLAFYSGWPNAISGVMETRKVFEERGIGPVAAAGGPPLTLDVAAEAVRKAAVDSNVGPTAPALAELTNRVLFGDLWRRTELAPRDRSLITMAALIAIGQPEQLPFHANRALDSGLTPAQAAAVATHLSFYAGWPRAMSAVPVLEKVFASRASAARARDLRIIRAAPDKAAIGPADRFSGTVRISGLYQGDVPARIGGATVAFAAGARTAWHTHPLGQTLFIISGRGWVQQEGAAREEVSPGDVVWIPANVRHWHGATVDQPMAHFAIAEAMDGSAVTWMELVSDKDYRGSQR